MTAFFYHWLLSYCPSLYSICNHKQWRTKNHTNIGSGDNNIHGNIPALFSWFALSAIIPAILVYAFFGPPSLLTCTYTVYFYTCYIFCCDKNLYIIVLVLSLEVMKMNFVTSSERSGLVRTVELCTQTWWSWRYGIVKNGRRQRLAFKSHQLSRPPSLE